MTDQPKPKPEFTWHYYIFGNNMIAGVIQTIALILVACLAFAMFSTWVRG